jgi:hypothetical protein
MMGLMEKPLSQDAPLDVVVLFQVILAQEEILLMQMFVLKLVETGSKE